jgi:hypothetical protein
MLFKNVDAPFIKVKPDTFKLLYNVVEPLIIVKPEIFNVFINVDAPVIYKLLKLVLLLINNIVFVEKLFKLLNMVVDVAFKLLILN